MKATLLLSVFGWTYAAWSTPGSPATLESERNATPRESRITVGNAALYAREVGRGTPIIVLHGGPDFDHSYLVPELDHLSDSFHLIYYDQRGVADPPIMWSLKTSRSHPTSRTLRR